MDVDVNHYDVLGLPSGAKLTEKEISKAYKLKALELHPDKRLDDHPPSRERQNKAGLGWIRTRPSPHLEETQPNPTLVVMATKDAVVSATGSVCGSFDYGKWPTCIEFLYTFSGKINEI
ncbi:hypothetical protein EZV62_011921 [Acer yangbiense]|uniref:J domain-containing protein n=1 Tax=Acer yangbiense TaxID=1000413 RepID=A0A5C7I6V8_9ROSI|nr:hypothetical protein EZV62_011921 [Acer yangbiense]